MATHSIYSCLKKRRDRRVWQAAVHRVTQSRTRLKGLSIYAQSKQLPEAHSGEIMFFIPKEPCPLPLTVPECIHLLAKGLNPSPLLTNNSMSGQNAHCILALSGVSHTMRFHFKKDGVTQFMRREGQSGHWVIVMLHRQLALTSFTTDVRSVRKLGTS